MGARDRFPVRESACVRPKAGPVVAALLLAALSLGMAVAPAGALTYLVKADGSGDAPTIHEAIFMQPYADTILVGPGTYTDLFKDRNYDYNNVILRPGITLLSTDGPESTILDADHSLHPEIDSLLSCRSVVYFGAGADSDTARTIVKGFTFESGHALSTSGGVRINGNTPRVPGNVRFENNIFRNIYGGIGGSIIIEGASQPYIGGNQFIDSYTCCGAGGTIFVNPGCAPIITNNSFYSDSTLYAGGGLALVGSHSTITGNTFTQNTGIQGGGIFATNGDYSLIEGNVFQQNRGVGVLDSPGSGRGGALCFTDGARDTVRNNVIVANLGDSLGAAIYIENASPTISHCTIFKNTAPGGAGGIHVVGDSVAVIDSVAIISNHGGGVEVGSGSVAPAFTGCDVYANDTGDFMGMPSPVGSNGNVSADPGFCDRDSVTLRSCSPFIHGGLITLGAAVDTCACAPRPVSNLSANAAGPVDRRVVLNWTASTTPGVTNYVVYGDTEAIADTTGRRLAVTGNVTSYSLYTTNHATWHFLVLPMDANGVMGSAGDETTVTPPVGATLASAVVQNPVVTSTADVYVVPEVPSSGTPAVAIRLEPGGAADSIPVALVSGLQNTWRGSVNFTQSGTYTISARLSLTGVGDSVLTRQLSVGVSAPGAALHLASPDGRALLTAPADPGLANVWFTAQPLEAALETANLPQGVPSAGLLAGCRLGPERDFAEPITVEFKLPPGALKDAAHLDILRWDGSSWSPLATQVVTAAGVARASLTRPGALRLVQGGNYPAAEVISPVAVFVQNSPNPFAGTTTLHYAIPADGNVRLAVYDVQGRQVKELASGLRAAGNYATEWNGTDDRGHAVSVGLYFARLECPGFTRTIKLSLAR